MLQEEVNQSTHITVKGIAGTRPREVAVNYIAKVLGARAEELFDIVKSVITDKEFDQDITGGLVLTGGGALIKSLPELGEYITGKPTKIGYPAPFGGMTNIMQNPKFSTVMGLLIESGRHKPLLRDKSQHQQVDLIGKLSDSLKSVFREIF